MTDTFTLKEIRREEISHGRITFQNLQPPLLCPQCGRKIEIVTFHGGLLIEELNKPSISDQCFRRSFVFVPKEARIEDAYSKFAKPAITFRTVNTNVTLSDFLG